MCQYVTDRMHEMSGGDGPSESASEQIATAGLALKELGQQLRDHRPDMEALVAAAQPAERASEEAALAAADDLATVADANADELRAVTDVDETATELVAKVGESVQRAYLRVCYGDEAADTLAQSVEDENWVVRALTSAEGVGCDSPAMVGQWIDAIPYNAITCQTRAGELRIDVYESPQAVDAGLKAKCTQARESGPPTRAIAVRGEKWVAYPDDDGDATSETLRAALGGTVIDPYGPSTCESVVAWDLGTPKVDSAFCPLWADFPPIPPLEGSVVGVMEKSAEWSSGWSTRAYRAKDLLDSALSFGTQEDVADDARRLSAALGEASYLAGEYSWAVKTAAERGGRLSDLVAATADWRRKLDAAFAAFDLRCSR